MGKGRFRLPPRAAIGFLLPNFLGLLVFVLLPVLLALGMAFTNWSLKPAVGLRFVGLRNFTDLLGVWQRDTGGGAAPWAYYPGALAVVIGAVLALWASASNWRGTRYTGLILLGLGALMAFSPLARALGPAVSSSSWLVMRILGSVLMAWARLTAAGSGTVIAGVVAVICGLAATFREGADWRLGRGVIGGLLILAGACGLALASGPMWANYELRDARFWQYFQNTAFLMSGIPAGIAGSLGVALLLNNPLQLGERRRRVDIAALLLVTGLVCSAMVYGFGSLLGWQAADDVALLLGLFCVVAALAAAFNVMSALLLVTGLVCSAMVFELGRSLGWGAADDAALLVGVFWIVAALAVAFNVVALRTLYYLPTFTAGVALMILWRALYNPDHGPINAILNPFLAVFGYRAPNWLASVAWAKPALMLMGLWITIGGTNMLLYLAALSNVPRDLLDAAEVDGAGTWAKFRHVTWPQLAPTTFFISIMSVIGGLQGGFEQARVMTEGGPAGATTTLSYYIYLKMYQDLELGYPAAISWVMFTVIFVATALNWRFGRGQEMDL